MASEFLVSNSSLYQGTNIALSIKFNRFAERSMTARLSGKDVNREEMDKDWAMDDMMDGSAQNAISGSLPLVVEFISQLPNVNSFKTMGDIGGNHGLYTMGVLEQFPNMQGTIFDLPHVVEEAQKRVDKAGFTGRITTQSLDLRTAPLPTKQFDLIFTSHVLYAVKQDLPKALANIANSLKPNGWFVSHHYAGRNTQGKERITASIELLTRLCGYPAHFIEKEELTDTLAPLEFDNFQFQSVSQLGLGLIVAAQKK